MMSYRRLIPDQRWRVRVALSLGILGGLMTMTFFALFRPNPPTTFEVFYYAAKQSMEGPVVFKTGYGLWTYTPISLLYFYPYAILFEYETAFFVHQILSVIVSFVYGGILADFLRKRVELSRIDLGLIVGFTTLSVYPVVNVINGSFVGMFTFLLGGGWLLLEYRNDGGGVAWALASLVKGYPAFWGVYLLRVKRWRATVAAIVTGVSATLLGVLIFGFDAYVRFFTVAGENRVRLQKFSNGGSPDNEMMTPIRGLSQLFQNVDPTVWPVVIFVFVIIASIFVYYLIPIESLNDRATLLLATIIGVFFIMPTSQDMDTYLLYAPLLVLLYTERHTVVQGLYTLATVVMSYNIGRDELLAVSEALGLAEWTMPLGEPVLMFAKMPTFALYISYTAILLSAWYKGKKSGRVRKIQERFERMNIQSNSDRDV